MFWDILIVGLNEAVQTVVLLLQIDPFQAFH